MAIMTSNHRSVTDGLVSDTESRDSAAREDGVRRVRTACLILAVVQGLYVPRGPGALSLSDPQLRLTIINFVVAMSIAGAMSYRPATRHWRFAAWFGCSVLIFTGTASSIIQHEIDSHLLTVVIFSLGPSVLMPWEPRWQGLLNISCLVSFAVLSFIVGYHDIDRAHRIAVLLGAIATSQANTFFSARYRDRIREAAVRTHSIVEGALDAFVAMNQDGVVEEWNLRACAMFGFSGAEAHGHLLSDLIIALSLHPGARCSSC